MAAITTLYDLLMVMKVRETTFSTDQVIVTASIASVITPLLRGTTGQSTFNSLVGAFSDFEYRYNGQLCELDEVKAPMNKFGIIHMRWKNGLVTGGGLMFGATLSFGTPEKFAKVDLAEIVAMNSLQPMSYMRELTEHESVKWAIGSQ